MQSSWEKFLNWTSKHPPKSLEVWNPEVEFRVIDSRQRVKTSRIINALKISFKRRKRRKKKKENGSFWELGLWEDLVPTLCRKTQINKREIPYEIKMCEVIRWPGWSMATIIHTWEGYPMDHLSKRKLVPRLIEYLTRFSSPLHD